MDTTDDSKKISDLDEKMRTKPGSLRRIVVDRTKCIGARSCVAVAPGVFQMDDQNLAYLVDPDSEDEDTIMLAAQSCPVLAVIIYDDQGKQIFPEE
jgi:ferredoxin